MNPSETRNIPSKILSKQENDIVFSILAKQKCLTLATTVVQVQIAYPNPTTWTKQSTGVLCFVKDYSLKSYFFRVFNIQEKTVLWEQEIYINFVYKKLKDYFHTFQAHDYSAAFNFADVDEASSFYLAVTNKLKPQRKETKLIGEDGQKSNPKTANIPLHVQVTRSSSQSGSSNPNFRRPKQRDKNSKKLTKADISDPTDFRVVEHIGYDKDTGSLVSHISDEWKDLYSTIGLTGAQLNDEHVIATVKNVVERYGGIKKANKELTLRRNEKTNIHPAKASQNIPSTAKAQQNVTPPRPTRPPPLPVGDRQNNMSRNAHLSHQPRTVPILTSPLSPDLPPPPKSVPADYSLPSPDPPPLSDVPPSLHLVSSHAPPPPPPPPPPPLPTSPSKLSKSPAVSVSSETDRKDTHPAKQSPAGAKESLFDEIRRGKRLNPVTHKDEKEISAPTEGTNISGPSDTKGSLFDEIRRGKRLNPVASNDEKENPPPIEDTGIFGALQNELRKINFQVQMSDPESDADDSDWSDLDTTNYDEYELCK